MSLDEGLFQTAEAYEQLAKRKELLDRLIREKQEACKNAPDGNIHVIANGEKRNKIQYYLRKQPSDGCGTYLKKGNDAIIGPLLQKDYDKKVLRIALEEQHYLEKLLSHCNKEKLGNVYEKMKEYKRAWISPVFLSNEEYIDAWQRVEYPRMGFAEHAPEFYTKQNERVRSKSEVLIANMLTDLKIPYRYECPLRDEREIWACPDFTILDIKSRKEYYLEHFGRMDDPEYVQKTLTKIEKYGKHGYFPGKELLFTFESSMKPINMRDVEMMLRRYFL